MAAAFLLTWIAYFGSGLLMASVGAFTAPGALFDTDVHRVIRDISNPGADHYRTNTHPLFVLLTNPVGSLLADAIEPLVRVGANASPAGPLGRAVRMGETALAQPGRRAGAATESGPRLIAQAISALLINSLCGALGVLFAWSFFRKIGLGLRDAGGFAALFGASASQWVFGGLPETHAFSACAIILTLLLTLVARPDLRTFVPVGIVGFGISLTNIVPIVVAFLYGSSRVVSLRRALARAALLAALVLAGTAALSVLQRAVYPTSVLFFRAGDQTTERSFLHVPSSAADVLTRVHETDLALFFFPLDFAAADLVVRRKDTASIPFVSLSWPPARGGTWPLVPVVAWSLLGMIALYALVRLGAWRDRLVWALSACLLFYFGLFTVYGDEPFLYTANWTFLVLALLALSLKPLLEPHARGGVVVRWMIAATLLISLARNGGVWIQLHGTYR